MKPIEPYTEADEAEVRSGIIIPESVKAANTPLPSCGFVVQVGEGLTEGQKILFGEGVGVMFSKFSGTQFTIDSIDYRILDLREIMCTFEFEEGEVALTAG